MAIKNIPPFPDNKDDKDKKDKNELPQEDKNSSFQNEKEQFSQEELRLIEKIKRKILNRENIDNYVRHTKEKILQQALKEVIKERISEDRSIDPSYISLLSQETIEEIKKDKEYQELIKERIKKRIYKDWYIPPSYLFLAFQETSQQALKEGIKERISEGRDINPSYISLLSQETIEEIKKDKEYQELIKERIKERMSNGLDISSSYISLLSQETIEEIKKDKEYQELIEKEIKEMISKGQDIHPSYLSLASQETLQQALKEGIKERISQGFSFYNYLNLLSPQSKKELFEKEKNLKSLVKQSILSHFNINDSNTKKEVEKTIDHILSLKNKEYLLKSIFDRTFTPMGLKFHTKEESGVLDDYFKKTGGFVAHQYKQCYITPPFPNPYNLELFFLALKNILDKRKRPLGQDMYIQACFPERLNNEMCGLLTIAFLFSKEKNIKFTPELLQHNQNQIGITIYDGGRFISKKHTFFNKEGQPINLDIQGRTDLLFCSSFEDIRNAQTIYTLLLHKEKQLYFHNLGNQFVQELTHILQQHNKEHWLNNKFIKLNNEQDINNLSQLLLEITKERKDVSQKIQKYNEGVDYYSQEQDPLLRKTLLHQLKTNLDKEINQSIYYQIKNLVQKYYYQMLTLGLEEGEI